MKPLSSPWLRLVAAARHLPQTAEEATPFGFSTRLAAVAFEPKRTVQPNAFAQLSWPALGFAALVMVVTVATNLKPVLTTFDDDVATLSEPVVETGESSL